MLQSVAPLTNFPISRVLPDPSDNTTYYVRAVVRNGSTGAVLANVNLLAQGNQIYSAVYRTPALASAQPLFLTITTTVYTDAGYSIPSTVYGNDQDTIQIFDTTNLAIIQAQQISAIVAGAVPAGSDIDYKKIGKIFSTALAEASKEPLAHLANLHELISEFHSKADLTSVLDAIEQKTMNLEILLGAVYAKTIDFAPVLGALREERLMSSIEMQTVFAPIEKAVSQSQLPTGNILAAITDMQKAVRIISRELYDLKQASSQKKERSPDMEAIAKSVAKAIEISRTPLAEPSPETVHSTASLVDAFKGRRSHFRLSSS